MKNVLSKLFNFNKKKLPFDEILLKKAIEKSLKIDNEIIKENLNSETIFFLEKFNINPLITNILLNFCYSKPIIIGNIYFNCVNNITEENLEDENINCIKSKLLIIGCGLNGDPIVIDLKTNEIGYVSHDELWEEEIIERKAYFNSNLSLGSFYFNASIDSSFPVDSSELRDKLLRCP